jgi:inhibitor of KinA sporulation pathway (predicted exonuclease)
MLLIDMAIRDIIQQNIIRNFSSYVYPWNEGAVHQECKVDVEANSNATFANGIIFCCLVNPTILK